MPTSVKAALAGIAALASLAILGLYLPDARLLFLLGKPLATLAIIALALRLDAGEPRYRRGILIGLAWGLLGDVLLMSSAEGGDVRVGSTDGLRLAFRSLPYSLE